MKKYLLLLSLLSVIACSDDDAQVQVIPGTGLPALTEEQKGRMAELSVEASDTIRASDFYEQANNVNGFTFQTQSPKKKLSEKGQKYKAEIDKLISEQKCKSEKNQNQSNGESSISISYSEKYIDSADCPFNSSISFAANGTIQMKNSSSGSINMNITGQQNFIAKEGTDLYALNSVYGYQKDLTLAVTAGGNESSGNATVVGKEKMILKSKKEGNVVVNTSVNVALSGSQSTTSILADITLDYQLQDFKVVGFIRTAAVEQVGTQAEQPKPNYFINGQSVEEAEFLKYFSEDAIDGIMNIADQISE